jgi:hypothetical protein
MSSSFYAYSRPLFGHRGERWKAKNSQALESLREKRCRKLQKRNSESNSYFYDGFGAVRQYRFFELYAGQPLQCKRLDIVRASITTKHRRLG